MKRRQFRFLCRLARWTVLIVAAILDPARAPSQATQGLVFGRVFDSVTGRPVEGAEVSCRHQVTNIAVRARSAGDGAYALPLLPPGNLRLSISREGYQPQQIFDLELPVAGRLEVPFRLRPLHDVWEAGQYRSVLLPGGKTVVTFYGPDVDTSRSLSFEGDRWRSGVLESTRSYVVEPRQISDLPLSGRDAYTALIALPGVTADTTTARSLGLAVNGQRPSASNFLLDGLENNNNLVTGPLVTVAPEAIEEYRVSTANYSAEYGGTTGYLANAVTRSGSNQWHGSAYVYLKNEALNANDFQDNLRGLGRLPAKELEPGFHVGGPIRKGSLFVSANYDRLRSRGRKGPTSFLIPSPQLLALVAPTSQAHSLLSAYPSPAVYAPGQSLYGLLTVSPPVSVDQSLALPRADYVSRNGAHHLSGRLALARLSRPDFAWSPYQAFSSGFDENDTGLALSLTSSFRPSLTNEARFGWSQSNVALLRPHPEIPALTTADSVTLPGSQIFSEFVNDTASYELLDNILYIRSRHAWKFGGGVASRVLSGDLTAARDGMYYFNSMADFAKDRPSYFGISLSRADLPSLRLPRFDRRYRLDQSFAFAQDSFRATSRLTLNYGVRYESHGAPRNTGEVKDALVELGGGRSLAEKLTTARLVFGSGSGSQSLLQADRNDWAARFGISWNPLGGATLVRAGYGLFYDRPFDNIWQNLRNNNFLFPRGIPARNTNYLAPVASVLPLYEGAPLVVSYRFLTAFQPYIRSPYVQSFFAGFEQRFGNAWVLEANAAGSLGRKLLTSDTVNRSRQFNPNLEELIYRGNQGISDYSALAVHLQHRGRSVHSRASYTWSHTIDNQSEVLSNDFFNLNPVRLTGSKLGEPSTFSRQFDSRGDRGNSAFDQRHNLVFMAIEDFPRVFAGTRASALFRDWKFSQLAAFRSGMPYSVFSPGAPYRVNLMRPDPVTRAGNNSVAGGKRLLDAAAFAQPAAGTGLLGNTGRNAFRGPGFYNLDASLARSFPLRWLGEGARIAFRADAFNLLNHANLNNPDAVFPSSTFGVALYGRKNPQSGLSGLPTLSPLNDTSRHFQISARVEF